MQERAQQGVVGWQLVLAKMLQMGNTTIMFLLEILIKKL